MKFIARTSAFATIACVLLAQAGCATSPAPDFKGRWKPANRYATATQAIPLQQPHVFQAAPMDGTLKNMLARWARDSELHLSYQHPSDFTLHAPVAQINTHDLQQAAAQLTSIYAGQHVTVSIDDNQIIVRQAGVAAAQATVPETATAIP